MKGRYIEPKHIYLHDSNFKEEERTELNKAGYDTLIAYMLPGTFVDRFTTLVQVLKSMIDQTNIGEKFDICSELDAEISKLLQSLVYLSNSTSFKKGDKYYDFDRREIDRKLGRKKGE